MPDIRQEPRQAPTVLDSGLLRALFDSLSAGVYATDREGVIVAVNPAAEELLGTPAALLLGRGAHDTLHYQRLDGQPRAAVDCPLLQVIVNGERARSDDDTFWRSDGSALPVWWLSSPVLVDGRVLGAVVIFDDATVRRQYQAKLATTAAQDRSEQGTRIDEHDQLVADHERLVMLARLGEVLSTLDIDEGLRRLGRLVVGPLADWCVMNRVEGRQVSRVAVTHKDPAVVPDGQFVKPMPPLEQGSSGSLARALLAGEPLHVTGLRPGEVTRWADPLDVEQARLFDALGAASALVIPLTARHQVLGAMTWVRLDPHEPFGPSDVEFAEEIGRRAGLALDNARLYGLQRQAAESLQRSLLTVPPQPEHLGLVARYLPAAEGAEVGGDWYDAFVQPNGDTTLVIGDVVGHDMVAASHMAQLRNLLRAVAVDRQESPAQVLARLDALIAALPVGALATCLVARLERDEGDPESDRRTVRWSSAGHPPPALIDPDGGVRLLSGESDLLLGVDAELSRTDHVVSIPAGSTLVLYTDGLIERATSTIDQGFARLRRALGAAATLPLDGCIDDTLGRLVEAGHTDDVAVIAVRTFFDSEPAPAG